MQKAIYRAFNSIQFLYGSGMWLRMWGMAGMGIDVGMVEPAAKFR